MFKLIIIIIIVAFVLGNEEYREKLSSFFGYEIEQTVDKALEVLEQRQSAVSKAPLQTQTYGERICRTSNREERIHCLDAAYQRIINEMRLALKEEI